MKKLWVVLGLLAAMQVGCASAKSSVLRPSALDATLSDLDADAANPFAKAPTQVEVLEVGVPAYDAFFRDAARVQGSVILADLAVKQLEASANAAADAASAGKPPSDAQKAGLQKQLDRVKLTGAMLADVPQRAAALAITGKELLGGMQRAFAGSNALNAPAVTQGLNRALDQLQDAADRAPRLADATQAAVKSSVAALDGRPAPVAPTKGKKQKKTASAAGKKVSRS